MPDKFLIGQTVRVVKQCSDKHPPVGSEGLVVLAIESQNEYRVQFWKMPESPEFWFEREDLEHV